MLFLYQEVRESSSLYIHIYIFVKSFFKRSLKFFFAHSPIEYEYFLKGFIWLIGTINPFPSGPGSNGNEGVLHISQTSRTGASPSDAVKCHTQDTRSIWSIDGILTGTINPFPRGPESNGNEELLHISQISGTIRYCLVFYLGHHIFLGYSKGI